MNLLRRHFGLSLPSIIIFFIALSALIIVFFTPYMGDDLSYKGYFHGYDSAAEAWKSFPGWVLFHWKHTNGRLANFILPPLLSLPKCFVAAICATAVWLMYKLALKLSGIADRLWQILLIGAVFFLMPWWDSTYLIAVQTNYIFASVGIMAVWYALFSRSSHRVPLWILCAVCLLGGMMHEAAFASFAFGLFVWFVINRPSLSRRDICLLCSFALGGFISVFSPNIILRAVSHADPDDPWWLIVLKSDWLPLILWINIGCAALNSKWAHSLRKIFRSPLCVIAVASFMGMLISAATGIVGRSGWFATLFAIITYSAWIHRKIADSFLMRSLKWLIASAIVAVSTLCIIWQIRIFNDFRRFMPLFMESKDGIVAFDAIRDTDIPILTLNRLRALPDASDAYLRIMMAEYYRKDSGYPLIVSPDATPYLSNGQISEEIILNNGDRILPTVNEADCQIFPFYENLPIIILKHDNREWVATQVGPNYYLYPLISDPGERL